MLLGYIAIYVALHPSIVGSDTRYRLRSNPKTVKIFRREQIEVRILSKIGVVSYFGVFGFGMNTDGYAVIHTFSSTKYGCTDYDTEATRGIRNQT